MFGEYKRLTIFVQSNPRHRGPLTRHSERFDPMNGVEKNCAQKQLFAAQRKHFQFVFYERACEHNFPTHRMESTCMCGRPAAIRSLDFTE